MTSLHPRPLLRRAAACLILAGLFTARAEAKVVFTGYADFRATAQGVFNIDGPQSVLDGFKLAPERLESRGATIDSLGLFATTSIDEQTRLLMDVTYRDIAGQTTKTIRIQYAYLEHDFDGVTGQVGKIMLPFGYYNQKRFYPFQRPAITGPLFQSAILGLPMTDIGATAGKTFDAGDLAVRTDVFAVNGFGSVPGSTTSLRNAGLPGGITLANNIASTDANHRIAVGGRVDLSHAELENSNVGASYYRGEWGPSGHLLQLADAHLHLSFAGCDWLTEYQFISAKGDEGLLQNVGSQDWRTDGFFSELDYDELTIRGKKTIPWIRFEDYSTRAYGGVRGDHENLWEAAAGAAVHLNDNLIAKLEGDSLSYRLPYQGVGAVTLRGYQILAGLTVTF